MDVFHKLLRPSKDLYCRLLSSSIMHGQQDGVDKHGGLNQKIGIKLGDISDFMDLPELVVKLIESVTSGK